MNRILKLIPAIGLALLLAALIACATEAPSEPRQPEQPAQAAPAQPAMASQAPTAAQPQQPAPALPAATAVPTVAPTPIPPARAGEPRPSAPTPVPPTPIPAVFPVTVQNGNGDDVTFDGPPERIVAFDGSVVDILFSIGEGHRIVATHQYVDYPPDKVASIPRVGDAFNMDIEAVVAFEPDLVFVFYDRFTEDLERVGLKTLVIPSLSDDFEKIADNIRMWGAIVGNPDAAERAAMDFEARVAAVRETMAPYGAGPVVFQDAGGYWTPGQGTMMQEVFDLLKLENAASEIQGYAQLSPEQIVEKDPALIIAGNPQAYLDDPAFANVNAVLNGNVLTLPSDALSIQSPRFMDGVEEMAALVYPGIFR